MAQQQQLKQYLASLITFLLYLTPNSAASTCAPTANKIKISSTTGQVVQMFEVQALSAGTNVALNKAATQSSTYSTKVASGANDGDSVTFSHTAVDDSNAWWQVDLGGAYLTEFVKIKNRYCTSDASDPNQCLCRLSNARVTFMNAQGATVATKTIGNTCGVHDVIVDLSTCDDTLPIPITNAIVSEDQSFSVTFANPMASTSIRAAVLHNSVCTDTNASTEVTSTTPNSFAGTTSVTVTKNIKDLITPQQKTSGSVKLNFCLRADVRHPSFPSSILATKVTVGVTVTFQTNGSFKIDMQAKDFAATYAGFTSERTVSLSANLGACATPGNEGPYAIGSTLKFCIKSAQSDVVISGLKEVMFSDANGNPILDIVDDTGKPSWVTTLTGVNSKSLDVRTLMTTIIYDQGYTTINVEGKVSVAYTNGRRRLRQLETEEDKPFALTLDIAQDTVHTVKDEISHSAPVSSFLNPMAGAAKWLFLCGALLVVKSLIR